MFHRITVKVSYLFRQNVNKELLQKSIHLSSALPNQNSSPLEGIRVLDLSRIIAGPYCTMVLGDLGAEIIKIEKPGSGDESRLWGPPFLSDNKSSVYFQAFNRNKKSVCVNIQSEVGRDILYSLAKTSDVLIENYVPGKLDKLQLGYNDFKKIAPHLVYCSITGFGPEGPYSHRPGYDVIASSIGGLIHITGPKDGEPCKVGVALIDVATGLYAHGAIMAALIKRSKTGQGQKIDCDLLSVTLSSLINIGSNYLNTGQEASRWGTAHASIVPYQAFPTKDGYFTIGTGSDKQYEEFCKLIGREDLVKNTKFLTNNVRVENRDELVGILSSIFKMKTNKEWGTIFENTSFPNGPVNNLQAAFNDPHVQHIGIVKTLDHSKNGKVKVIGPPVIYSEGGNEVRSAPPALGQHTDEVLSGILGYSKEQIKDLRDRKIVS